MAYYLTIKEKNNFKLLDISSLIEFNRYSKFKGNSYSLDEIDIFTSQFKDELELKERLYNKGIITSEDILKDITIRRKNKDELEKVMYGLVFQYNRKFIDIMYLRVKILELQNDVTFLNKLLNHYRNNYRQEHLTKIRAILNNYHGREINMHEALSSFFMDEVLETERETGVVKVKYKSFHDLAMFVYNYITIKNKSELEINNDKLIQESNLRELQKALITQETQVHVKKKVKKVRKEIEGQTSFF